MAAPRARRARAVPRKATRPRAARANVHGATTRAATRASPRADQSRAPRSKNRRRAGKHLRRRSALAGAGPPASPRRDARRRRTGAPDTLDQGRPESRRQAAGREPARLLHPGRWTGPHAGPLSRLRPRRASVSALRNADRQDPHRRTRHVVLPELPASRTSRGELVAQAAIAVEAPQLGVATDRLPVDEYLRNRPAAGQIEELLPKGRVVVERDLLVLDAPVLEQRLRADAIAAPASGVNANPGHIVSNEESPAKVPSTAETRLAGPWPDALTRPT